MVKNIPEFKGTIALGLFTSKPANSSNLATSSAENRSPSSKKDSQRHEEAERRRLESVQRQRELYAQKKNLISSALKNLDSSTGKPNKKIKFASSSSSSESESDAEIPASNLGTNYRKSTNAEDSSGRKKLFDDDDDGEEEDANIEFSAPKFDGAIGSKLLELQSRFGGADSRFRLDERFLDDQPDEPESYQGPNEGEDATNSKQERHSNIRILERVLGKPLEKPDDDSPKKNKAVPYLRFDPNNPAHRRYQVKKDDQEQEAKKQKAKKDREKGEEDDDDGEESESSSSSEEESEREEPANSTSAPVGLDSGFAEELRQKIAQKASGSGVPAESGFSLRRLFGREEITAPEENGIKKLQSSTATNLPSWQRSVMQVRDSSSEDEGEGDGETSKPSAGKALEKRETLKTKTRKIAGRSTFFFYEVTDVRITAEAEKFCRLEDLEVVRKRWEKQRVGLIQFYKSRRKEAVKKQRLRQEREELKNRKAKTAKKIEKFAEFEKKRSKKNSRPKQRV